MVFSLALRNNSIPPLFCVLVLSVVTLSSSCAYAFKVGFFVFEPHAMLIDGQQDGAAVTYLRDYIAPEMGIEVDFEGPVSFTRLLFDFSHGAYDAVLLLAKNPERARDFVYPSQPYGFMESSLLVPKDFPHETLTSPSQLKGLVIGYARKAWRTPFMRDKSLKFDMITTRYSTDTNFHKLDEGRVDCIYSPDKNALLYGLKTHVVERPCKLLVVPGPKVGFYTVFHPSVSFEIVRRYEKALSKVQALHSYESLVEEYLSR